MLVKLYMNVPEYAYRGQQFWAMSERPTPVDGQKVVCIEVDLPIKEHDVKIEGKVVSVLTVSDGPPVHVYPAPTQRFVDVSHLGSDGVEVRRMPVKEAGVGDAVQRCDLDANCSMWRGHHGACVS